MIVNSGQESQLFVSSGGFVQSEQIVDRQLPKRVRSEEQVTLGIDSINLDSSNLESISVDLNQHEGISVEAAANIKESMVVSSTLAHPRRKLDMSSKLYETGKEASALYIVNQGLLKAIVPTAIGRDRIADIYGPGDLLGTAAIEGSRHVETVIALQECILTPIDPKLGLVHGKSSRFIANALAKQMRRHREALDDAELPVGARLTRIILRMCERFGEVHSTTSVRLPIALTHEDFAAFTGSSRVTITRILGELRQVSALTGSRGVYTANPVLLEKATDQFVLKVL